MTQWLGPTPTVARVMVPHPMPQLPSPPLAPATAAVRKALLPSQKPPVQQLDDAGQRHRQRRWAAALCAAAVAAAAAGAVVTQHSLPSPTLSARAAPALPPSPSMALAVARKAAAPRRPKNTLQTLAAIYYDGEDSDDDGLPAATEVVAAPAVLGEHRGPVAKMALSDSQGKRPRCEDAGQASSSSASGESDVARPAKPAVGHLIPKDALATCVGSTGSKSKPAAPSAGTPVPASRQVGDASVKPDGKKGLGMPELQHTSGSAVVPEPAAAAVQEQAVRAEAALSRKDSGFATIDSVKENKLPADVPEKGVCVSSSALSGKQILPRSPAVEPRSAKPAAHPFQPALGPPKTTRHPSESSEGSVRDKRTASFPPDGRRPEKLQRMVEGSVLRSPSEETDLSGAMSSLCLPTPPCSDTEESVTNRGKFSPSRRSAAQRVDGVVRTTLAPTSRGPVQKSAHLNVLAHPGSVALSSGASGGREAPSPPLLAAHRLHHQPVHRHSSHRRRSRSKDWGAHRHRQTRSRSSGSLASQNNHSRGGRRRSRRTRSRDRGGHHQRPVHHRSGGLISPRRRDDHRHAEEWSRGPSILTAP
eukprot:RCo042913